jgi:hypothetical protein
MSSQRRSRAITRWIARFVQVRRDFDTLALLIDFDLDTQLAQHAPEALHYIFIVPSVLLHTKQEAVQNRIIARVQALLREDMFVRVEKRAGRR